MLEDENIQFGKILIVIPTPISLHCNGIPPHALPMANREPDEPVNLRDVPYETKKHRMQVMKRGQEEKAWR